MYKLREKRLYIKFVSTISVINTNYFPRAVLLTLPIANAPRVDNKLMMPTDAAGIKAAKIKRARVPKTIKIATIPTII